MKLKIAVRKSATFVMPLFAFALPFCEFPRTAIAAEATTRPANAGGLTVGDAPPPIQVAAWFKGNPVTRFEKGHVYVVEFWATWCGPCKVTIPHLTELAKKYAGRVDVAGISVSEQPETPTNEGIAMLVRPFVEQMGAKMDYAVGADGIDGFMSRNWMLAAGVQSIPTAFVIDKQTRIAWIGNAANLDDVVAKVVEGTWNTDKAMADAAGATAHEAKLKALMVPVNAALKNQDYVTALQCLTHATDEAPDLAVNPDVVAMRVFITVHTSGKEAVAYVQSIAAENGVLTARPGLAGALLRVLPLQRKSELLTADEWKSIGVALKPFLLANPTNFVGAAGYADIIHHAGDTASAIEYKQSALAIATTQPNSPALKNWVAAQQKTLETMRTDKPQTAGAASVPTPTP